MLFSKLSNVEKETIIDYIETYGSSHEGSKKDLLNPLDYILRYWNENKQSLFKMFGEKLILSKKICIDMNIEDIEKNIFNTAIDDYEYSVINAFEEYLCNRLSFDLEEITHEQANELLTLFTASSLAKNIYTGKTISFIHKEKTIQIQNGMKAMKAIKKLADLAIDEGYVSKHAIESFQLTHSKCLNQKHLEGTLCLSIHPLDFMTMSDNNCDWSSCMNWRDIGEYRAGTVEMMNSPYVVVAYLKSNHDFNVVDDYIWTNKKWRELFIVSPEILCEVKPYPYVNSTLTEEVLKWLKELNKENSYYDELATLRNRKTTSINDFIYRISLSTDRMYNDFNSQYIFKGYIGTKANTEIRLSYSGENICMLCGQLLEDEDSSYNYDVFCHECNNRVRCSICGEWCSPDDDLVGYELDGEQVCFNCYCDNTYYCYMSGKRYSSSTTTGMFVNIEKTGKTIVFNSDYLEKFIECFGPVYNNNNPKVEEFYFVKPKNFNLEKIEKNISDTWLIRYIRQLVWNNKN